MRNLILALVLVVGPAAGLAQGTFYFDNYGIRSSPGVGGPLPSTSLTATSHGAFFINGVELSASNPNIFYGTVVANGVTLGVNLLLDVGVAGELLADSGAAFYVSGVPGYQSTTITISVWEDLQRTGQYVASDPWATATFDQVLGGWGIPPSFPNDLYLMPAVNLVVPEPGTFALAGLGGVAVLVFRRGKAEGVRASGAEPIQGS